MKSILQIILLAAAVVTCCVACTGCRIAAGTAIAQPDASHQMHSLQGVLRIHPKYAYKYYLTGFGLGQECGLFGESALKNIPPGSRIRVEGQLGTRSLPREGSFRGSFFIYMDVVKAEVLRRGE